MLFHFFTPIEQVVLAVLLSFVRITVNLIGLSFHPKTGKYLLVMDCADGNLEQYSVLDKTNKSTFWARVWRICHELLSHLINMHEANILHRDLHPGNIVLDHSEMAAVHLIDIGLGAVIGSKRESMGIYGRLDYLPPEQFRQQPYTEASEIYCLGTLMWQTITGVPPRGTAFSIPEHGLREDIPPGTPDTLSSIIQDCWNLNPAMRPRARDLKERMNFVRDEIAQLELSPETQAFIIDRHRTLEAGPKSGINAPSTVSSRTTIGNLKGNLNGNLSGIITISSEFPTTSNYYTFEQLRNMNSRQTGVFKEESEFEFGLKLVSFEESGSELGAGRRILVDSKVYANLRNLKGAERQNQKEPEEKKQKNVVVSARTRPYKRAHRDLDDAIEEQSESIGEPESIEKSEKSDDKVKEESANAINVQLGNVIKEDLVRERNDPIRCVFDSGLRKLYDSSDMIERC